MELTSADIRKLKKIDWIFDWKAEAKGADKAVYKLVIVDNPNIIQGLISLQDRGDHILCHSLKAANSTVVQRRFI